MVLHKLTVIAPSAAVAGDCVVVRTGVVDVPMDAVDDSTVTVRLK